MNKISNREIWVVNATTQRDEKDKYVSLPPDNAFSEKELETFEKISELEGVYPYCEFLSTALTEEQKENTDRTVVKKGTGKNEVRVEFGEEKKNLSYAIIPYLPDQLMDQKSEFLDDSVADGWYVSSSMAELLNMGEASFGTVAAEALVPVKRKVIEFTTEDGDPVRIEYNICREKVITGQVRGILEKQVRNTYTNSTDNVIYIPYDQMTEILSSETDIKLEEDEIAWRPNACIMSVKNYSQVLQAKEKVSRLSHIYSVYTRFQDYESMKAGIASVKEMTYLSSIMILSVIFLLMAVIYMNYIESRKYEFSILKANGFTRADVLALTLIEALFQVVKTSIWAMIFAGLIMVLTNDVIFQNPMMVYDWNLILVLIGTSFLSIFIPTIITLIFANHYDPDKIMRY